MAVEHPSGEYFDGLETMSAGERAAYQSRRLAETVAYAYRHAPAVRELLEKAGVSPGQIGTAKDLAKLPVTRKNDLIEMQQREPPYGGLLMIPPEDVERVFLSPGPIYEPIQHSGIRWFAKAFWAAGFRRGDTVVNTFTYHLSPAGILFHEAIRDCGATAVPMGVGNTDIQVQTMRDLKVTGFVGTPSFLMTVIKRAEEMGLDFRRDFCLRRAWFTGEMLPESLRETLEKDYRIATAQAYAVTEPGGAIAYECREKRGMHFMDEYLVEIIDPQTGRQLGPGEVGEIAVTPLHNRTWGLIRFGTGDLSSYVTDPCPCGRTAPRLTGILGRAGDAVKVRGMFIVARQVANIMGDLPAVASFQIVVGRTGHRDELRLRVELAAAADRAALAAEIEKRFQSVCRLKPDGIEFLEAGSLDAGGPKIVDKRQWR